MTYHYPETDGARPEDLSPADRERYNRCVGVWQAVADIEYAVHLLKHELDQHDMAPPHERRTFKITDPELKLLTARLVMDGDLSEEEISELEIEFSVPNRGTDEDE